jgi:hypothetical protein
VKKSGTGSETFIDGVRKISPFLAGGITWYVLSALLHLSFKIWIPIVLVVTVVEAVFVLGQLYKPFLVDKKGKCIGSRGSVKSDSMEKCRHYFPGSQYGGCGRREENGMCRLRMQ